MQRRKYALLKQPFELDALGDVSLTNPVLGDVMYYDGAYWINTPYAELVDDRVASLLVAGNNIDLTYNDGAGTITIDVEALTSADISDFAEAVDDRVNSLLVAGSGIAGTYNDGANTYTIAVDVDGLTADGAPDGAADYVMTYDASDSGLKKVLLNDLPGGGGGDVATDAIWDAAGDLAVGSGANTAARLAIGAEGDVLTVSSGAVAWAAPSGGGGSALPHPDVPPTSPNAMDDEFDDDSFDTTKWSDYAEYDSGTTAVTESYSECVMATAGGNSGVYKYQSVSGTFKIRAKMRMTLSGVQQFTGTFGNYHTIGIFAAHTTNHKFVSNHLEYGSSFKLGPWRGTNGSFSNNTGMVTVANMGHYDTMEPIYFEIEGDGTNLILRASRSGQDGTYTQITTETYASFLGSAPNRVGFYVSNGGNATGMFGYIDWFRRVA